MEAANRLLREHYIAEFSQRYAMPVAQRGPAFVPANGQDLGRLFSVHYEGVAAEDNTVNWCATNFPAKKPWQGLFVRLLGPKT